MTTREDLELFAVTNGFYLHPDRDIDHFVSLLNSRGGKCPCDDYRICPCSQATGEAQRAIQEDRHKEAACTCHLFVTPEYITAWKLKVNTSSPPANSQKANSSSWEIQNPMLLELMGVFKKAEKLMEKGKIEDAAEVLTTKANESECEMCQNLLATERLRMDYLGKLCEIDADECELEKQKAKERTKRIEKFIQKVDEYSATGQIDGQEPTDEPAEPPPRKSDAYHTCLKTIPATALPVGALPEHEVRVRFAIASKMCAKEGKGIPTTFEEELAHYKFENPNMFVRKE